MEGYHFFKLIKSFDHRKPMGFLSHITFIKAGFLEFYNDRS